MPRLLRKISAGLSKQLAASTRTFSRRQAGQCRSSIEYLVSWRASFGAFPSAEETVREDLFEARNIQNAVTSAREPVVFGTGVTSDLAY